MNPRLTLLCALAAACGAQDVPPACPAAAASAGPTLLEVGAADGDLSLGFARVELV